MGLGRVLALAAIVAACRISAVAVLASVNSLGCTGCCSPCLHASFSPCSTSAEAMSILGAKLICHGLLGFDTCQHPVPITDFPSTQTSIARAEYISPCTCRCKSERRSERVRKRHRERERYRYRPTDERADGRIIGIHVHPNI